MKKHYQQKKSILTQALTVIFLSFLAFSAQAGEPQSYRNIHFNYNTQRTGGDYTHFQTQNFQSCAEACANDSRCQAMDFNITDNSCWLKDSVPSSRPSQVFASGVKQGNNNVADSSNPKNEVYGIQLFDNLKRNGGDYKNFTVANVEECARVCSGDNNCQSFNYGKEKRDCWLKNNVPGGTPNDTVISGVKRH